LTETPRGEGNVRVSLVADRAVVFVSRVSLEEKSRVLICDYMLSVKSQHQWMSCATSVDATVIRKNMYQPLVYTVIRTCAGQTGLLQRNTAPKSIITEATRTSTRLIPYVTRNVVIHLATPNDNLYSIVPLTNSAYSWA